MKPTAILACAVLAFSSPWASAAFAANTTTGAVFESGHCTGIAHAVIRFSPPRDSTKSSVATVADDKGRFSASLDGDGDYYVTIYDGNVQIFGQVLNIQSAHPLLIPLAPRSGQALPCGECESRFDKSFTSLQLNNSCTSQFVIYERTYLQVPDCKFQSELFIYVADMYRRPWKEKGSLYVVIGPNVLPPPSTANRSASLEPNAFRDLHLRDSYKLIFNKVGDYLEFEYKERRYRLTVRNIDQLPGGGNQSVTVDICPD